MYTQGQATVQQAQSRGARHQGTVGEGGEDPRPPGHILPNGFGQEPEVEVVTVTDDDVAVSLAFDTCYTLCPGRSKAYRLRPEKPIHLTAID